MSILPNNNPKTYKMTENALERCCNNFYTPSGQIPINLEKF